MKLGVLVNDVRHRDHLVGLVRAAVSRGHEVLIFTMDAGTRLIPDPAVLDLCRLPGVTLSLCAHSAKANGVNVGALGADVCIGSQMQNALMHHHADRVVVL